MKEKRIILPKAKLAISEPLIFLAGPVQGAPRWQDTAIGLIRRTAPNVYIAAPTLNVRQEYLDERLVSPCSDFAFQLDWERNYLQIASERGVIMFWLPRQIEAMPINSITGFPQPYARDTRPELGGWGWKLLETNPKAKVVLGYEEGFDGIDVITRNFLRARSNMTFYNNLEETCNEAVRLAA